MKIINCKNVGCLHDIDEDIDLSQSVFIYGLNGTGKSTIKKLFTNAFKAGAALPVSFGKTSNDCSCKVQVFQEIAEYKKSRLVLPIKKVKLHVYDTDYVENSIYVNGEVSDSNKTEYYRLFVGDSINDKISKVLDINHELLQECDSIKKTMSDLSAQKDNIKAIIKLIDEVESKLKTKYTINYAIEQILLKRIKKQVKKVDQISVNWLIDGKTLQKNNEFCPFCGQELNSELQEYVNHYSSITIKSLKYVENIRTEINILIKNLNVLDTSAEMWFGNDFDISNYVVELVSLLENKKNKLDSSILLDKKFIKLKNNLIKKLNKFDELLNDSNVLINKMRIDNIFVESYESIERSSLNSVIDKINKQINNEIIKNYVIDLLSEMFKNQRKIKDKMSKIRNDQLQMIGDNLLFINEKLGNYGFKYSLQIKSSTQKNLKSSTSPLMNLELIPKNVINVKKDFNKTSVKNVLSEGEKAILSWVFFLLDLRLKLNKDKHLLIIDDPISSYDSFRRFNLLFDLRELKDSCCNLELLIISHEKSFTNVMTSFNRISYFNVTDGKIKTLDPKEIIESDLRYDLLFLKENKNITNLKQLLMFIIISRNVIEFSNNLKVFANGKKVKDNKYFNNYGIASSLIHFTAHQLPTSYIEYIQNRYKDITHKKIEFIIDESIDLNNLDFSAIVEGEVKDIHFARIRINLYLIKILRQNNVSYNNTDTTGKLLDLAKKYIDKEEYLKFKSFIPLLNVYNHPSENYGLRRIDCSEIKTNELLNYISNL